MNISFILIEHGKLSKALVKLIKYILACFNTLYTNWFVSFELDMFIHFAGSGYLVQ